MAGMALSKPSSITQQMTGANGSERALISKDNLFVFKKLEVS